MDAPTAEAPTAAAIAAELSDARARSVSLFAGLEDEQLLGPRLDIVNPPLWELGHVAWFQERWTIRELGQAPVRPGGDALYDSATVPQEVRWDLPLPSREETVRFLEETRDRALARLEDAERRGLSSAEARLFLLAVAHEDMHAEALVYSRQTLGWPAPAAGAPTDGDPAGPLPGDVEVPGGTFLLGAPADGSFWLDNEEWEHPVEVAPFRIARAPVTQEEFAGFVADDGYRRRELWSAEGWTWREEAAAEAPLHWRRDGAGRYLSRDFDHEVLLEPHRPMVHVCWHEAQAFCRWADRRLPTEAEWELAAGGPEKRRLPWGEDAAGPGRANVGPGAVRTVDVAAFPEGDSPSGCRQMIGNVWEWTASPFGPYPGFSPGPYREYSEPWFTGHRVLRGGSFATAGRLLRNTFRNFYPPGRRDVFAGFRTCPR